MNANRTDRSLLAGLALAALIARPTPGQTSCAADFTDPATGDPTHLELLVSAPAGDDSVDRAVFDPECATRYRLSGIASTIGIPPRLDFYLVVDRSGSTRDPSGVDLDGDAIPDTVLQAEVAAARAFVDAVDLDNNRVAIVEFDSNSQIRQALTRSRDLLHRSLDALLAAGPGSDTNYGAALREAVREHDGNADPSREQVVLFLSDGRPTTQIPDPPPIGLGDCSTFEHGVPGCNGILWAEHLAVTRGLRVETFAVGRFATREVLQEMADRAGGRMTTVEVAGDVVSVLPEVNLVGVDRVIVKSLDTLEEGVAELRPDGTWTAEIGILPGDNDLVITAHSDHDDDWSVSCERRVTLTCASFECPEPAWRECRDGGGLVESLRPWTSHSLILVDSSHDPDGDGDAGGVYGLGLTEVDFLLTDAMGNQRSCATFVEVEDTIPPELLGVPASGQLECSEPPAPAAVRAEDLCAGELPVALEERVVVLDCPANRDLTRSWSAVDEAGHRVEARQELRLRDTQPPVVQAGESDLHCFRAANHWTVSLGPEDFAPVVGDGCSEIAGWAIVGCESDQPEDDRGDGRTLSDCSVTADGGLLLRGERDGRRKEGRRYGVLVSAVDACGNWSEPARIGYVRVLHDLRGGEHHCPIVSHAGSRD